MQTVLSLIGGRFARIFPLQVSAGAASAGSIVALNGAGIVDPSMLGWLSGSNANGKWRQAADGYLTQTGEVSLVSGAATILFPRAFVAACDFVGLMAVTGTTTLQDISIYQTAEAGLASVTIAGSMTTVGVGAAVGGASIKVRWIAVGT